MRNRLHPQYRPMKFSDSDAGAHNAAAMISVRLHRLASKSAELRVLPHAAQSRATRLADFRQRSWVPLLQRGREKISDGVRACPFRARRDSEGVSRNLGLKPLGCRCHRHFTRPTPADGFGRGRRGMPAMAGRSRAAGQSAQLALVRYAPVAHRRPCNGEDFWGRRET